jgi:hypothetical protein
MSSSVPFPIYLKSWEKLSIIWGSLPLQTLILRFFRFGPLSSQLPRTDKAFWTGFFLIYRGVQGEFHSLTKNARGRLVYNSEYA